MRVLLIPAAALLLAAAEPPPAPDRPLPDVAQEARARALFAGIRCVVCQHESIADSPAGVAADMRRLVREQIADGATDQQVRDGLTARYGDYVLFKPPFRAATLILWLGPALAALLALFALLALRRRPAEPAPLSAEEEARLQSLLETETLRPDPDANPPEDGR